MSRRKAPVGLVICAITLLVGGVTFLVFGILLCVAPESLRDAGFRANPTLGIRVAGLLVFGVFGALLAWPAWGLLRLKPFAFEVARGVALAVAGLFVTRIVGGGASVTFNWLALVAAGGMAGYLSLPAVRGLFRP